MPSKILLTENEIKYFTVDVVNVTDSDLVMLNNLFFNDVFLLKLQKRIKSKLDTD